MALDSVTSMTPRTRRRLAWVVPVAVAGVVAGGVAVATAGSSDAAPKLAARTPAQLLTAVQTHTTTALYGQIYETANLGLPELPGPKSTASLSWQTFLSGSHFAKVWIAGPDQQRVALTGELSEAEVVHNGKDVWTYVSDTNTVTHTVLKDGAKHTGSRPAHPDVRDLTPAAAAAKVLEAVRPTTDVSVGSARTVAGQAAYSLVIKPKDSNSSVRKVVIAVDAKRYVPLRVQIFGSAATPAFETGFSSVTFATPAASTFAFTAPKGSTTSTDPLGASGDGRRHHHDGPRTTTGHATTKPRTSYSPLTTAWAHSSPTVIGSGWTTVVELPQGLAAGTGGLLDRATTPIGSTGRRLLHTALINAVFLPDGRVFVGAVSPTFLERVAATH